MLYLYFLAIDLDTRNVIELPYFMQPMQQYEAHVTCMGDGLEIAQTLEIRPDGQVVVLPLCVELEQ